MAEPVGRSEVAEYLASVERMRLLVRDAAEHSLHFRGVGGGGVVTEARLHALEEEVTDAEQHSHETGTPLPAEWHRLTAEDTVELEQNMLRQINKVPRVLRQVRDGCLHALSGQVNALADLAERLDVHRLLPAAVRNQLILDEHDLQVAWEKYWTRDGQLEPTQPKAVVLAELKELLKLTVDWHAWRDRTRRAFSDAEAEKIKLGVVLLNIVRILLHDSHQAHIAVAYGHPDSPIDDAVVRRKIDRVQALSAHVGDSDFDEGLLIRLVNEGSQMKNEMLQQLRRVPVALRAARKARWAALRGDMFDGLGRLEHRVDVYRVLPAHEREQLVAEGESLRSKFGERFRDERSVPGNADEGAEEALRELVQLLNLTVCWMFWTDKCERAAGSGQRADGASSPQFPPPYMRTNPAGRSRAAVAAIEPDPPRYVEVHRATSEERPPGYARPSSPSPHPSEDERSANGSDGQGDGEEAELGNPFAPRRRRLLARRI